MINITKLIALALMGLAATGCANLQNDELHSATVEEKFPITVEPHMVTVSLRVDQGAQRLAHGERERVAVMADRWKSRGRGQITVSGPQGSPNQRAAELAMTEVTRILAEAGVPKGSVILGAFPAHNGDPEPPVTMSFVTLVAVGPECGGDWSQNLGFTPRNTPWPSFGCATQRNLAAMVADPRDLVEPKPLESGDALRRSKVLNTYRTGIATQTTRKADESGQVSTVDAAGGGGQ